MFHDWKRSKSFLRSASFSYEMRWEIPLKWCGGALAGKRYYSCSVCVSKSLAARLWCGPECMQSVPLRELRTWKSDFKRINGSVCRQWELKFVLRACLQSGEVHKGKCGKAGTTESLSRKSCGLDDKHLQANITCCSVCDVTEDSNEDLS